MEYKFINHFFKKNYPKHLAGKKLENLESICKKKTFGE